MMTEKVFKTWEEVEDNIDLFSPYSLNDLKIIYIAAGKQYVNANRLDKLYVCEGEIRKYNLYKLELDGFSICSYVRVKNPVICRENYVISIPDFNDDVPALLYIDIYDPDGNDIYFEYGERDYIFDFGRTIKAEFKGKCLSLEEFAKTIEDQIMDLYAQYAIPAVKEEIIKRELAAIEAKRIKVKRYEYTKHMRSEKWQKLRLACFKRDDFRCVRCGTAKNINALDKEKFPELHAHHLTYRHVGDDELKDLITLCDRCHAEIHAEDLLRKDLENEEEESANCSV